MSDTTCPTCGSDERSKMYGPLRSAAHFASNCPDSWHDEQPTTPEDVEAAFRSLYNEVGYTATVKANLATLRAHIEALTAERNVANDLARRSDEKLTSLFTRMAVLEAALRWLAEEQASNHPKTRDAAWWIAAAETAALAAAEEGGDQR